MSSQSAPESRERKTRKDCNQRRGLLAALLSTIGHLASGMRRLTSHCSARDRALRAGIYMHSQALSRDIDSDPVGACFSPPANPRPPCRLLYPGPSAPPRKSLTQVHLLHQANTTRRNANKRTSHGSNASCRCVRTVRFTGS